MAELFKACGSSNRGKRDQMLLVLLYRLGFRCNEACTVRFPEDVRRVEGGWQIRTVNPKGANPKPNAEGKVRRPAPPRTLSLDPKSQFILESWLAVRGGESGYLVETSRGARIENSHVRRLLKTLCRRAGITRRISPHALRHAFASELVEEHTDMRDIQQLLGHRYLTTTIEYIDLLRPRMGQITGERSW
jgi:integrase/recombinase XerC